MKGHSEYFDARYVLEKVLSSFLILQLKNTESQGSWTVKGIELRGKRAGWGWRGINDKEVSQGPKVTSGDFRVICFYNLQNDLNQVPSRSAALSPLIWTDLLSWIDRAIVRRALGKHIIQVLFPKSKACSAVNGGFLTGHIHKDEHK